MILNYECFFRSSHTLEEEQKSHCCVFFISFLYVRVQVRHVYKLWFTVFSDRLRYDKYRNVYATVGAFGVDNFIRINKS